MIDTLLKIFLAGLTLWKNKDATRYIDQVTDLRKQYYDENNKPEGVRDDAVLDNIRFQLLNLADGFAAEIAAQKT